MRVLAYARFPRVPSAPVVRTVAPAPRLSAREKWNALKRESRRDWARADRVGSHPSYSASQLTAHAVVAL